MSPQIFAVWVTKLLPPDEIRRFDGTYKKGNAGRESLAKFVVRLAEFESFKGAQV
jgi:hypothetical protein